MEYEKVELLGLKDTLEHLLDFIWKMETSPPYFYGIFDSGCWRFEAASLYFDAPCSNHIFDFWNNCHSDWVFNASSGTVSCSFFEFVLHLLLEGKFA